MRKPLAMLLVLAACVFLLAGCQQEPQLTPVKLNEVTRSVFYAPQYVALSLGYFEEEGLDVEITTGGGSDKTMTALLSGQADIGLMGPETGIYVVNEGKEEHPIVVGQLTKRDGSFLVGRADEPDFSWENLRGATIIGGRKGGMPCMALLYVLKQHGLTPGTDIEVIDSIQFNLMSGAFEGGEGDYVTLFEPTASLFQNEGKGYIVANVGEASGEIPYTTYMVTPGMLKEKPELVESFLRAIYRAQQWIVTATDTQIAEAMQPFFPDATITMLEYVAKSYRATDSWKTDLVLYEKDFEHMQDIIESAGELKARVSFGELVDNTIAQKLLNE